MDVSSSGLLIAACAAAERAFIIGGAQIYAEALPLADVLWISEVQAEVEGDARFPGFAASQFHEVGRQSFAASESNEFAFDVVEYRPA